MLDNKFFRLLFKNQWKNCTMKLKQKTCLASDGQTKMFHTDVMFKNDKDLSKASKPYENNNMMFLQDFAAAWTKIANADRFFDPDNTLCIP